MYLKWGRNMEYTERKMLEETVNFDIEIEKERARILRNLLRYFGGVNDKRTETCCSNVARDCR